MCLNVSPCGAAITVASYVNPTSSTPISQNRCSVGTRFPLPVALTAPSALLSSFFTTSSPFQQQQKLLQQQAQNFSAINCNRNSETSNTFSELNTVKEPALNPNTTCYPLLPSLESLLPLTLLQLDRIVANSMFTPQTSPIPITSALTSKETKNFQQPTTEWTAPIGYPFSLKRPHKQHSKSVENNSEHQSSLPVDMKQPSDFSINRLLWRHCSESALNKCSDIPASSRHQHNERISKGRKQRTIYGVSQTKILEKAFEERQYMVGTGK